MYIFQEVHSVNNLQNIHIYYRNRFCNLSNKKQFCSAKETLHISDRFTMHTDLYHSFLLAWMLARVGHDVGRSWGDWRKPTCPSRRPMYPIIYNNCRSWGLNLGRSGDKQVHCPLHNWTPLSSF